mgnify:CR=1 FL=1
MKKLPLAFSGCLLGLAGAGNLILDTVPLLSHVFSLSGLIYGFIFYTVILVIGKRASKNLRKLLYYREWRPFPWQG